jgi:DNA topoisomerase-3
VAADLAKALGKVPKQGEVYENEEWVICSAVGHLVELLMPEDIDKKKYGFWRLETLPIIPEKFELKVIEDSKDKFSTIKKQLARKDIDQVINACDAGREGELIFSNLYQHAKGKLPVKRAWMQTMTSEGIKEAFRNLRDGSQMDGLADAARCRSESDWLIGLNGTRALTKRMFGSRAGNVASVGRVQTPTLAIIMAREIEIRNFKARAFWRITGRFGIATGAYEGTYQRPNFKKSDADDADRIDRVWLKAQAEAVVAACKGQPLALVSEEKKATTQASPRLYDLTTLQREANGRFGLSAKRTLQIAQALYERHKMITYPRTDARALPEDYIPTCRQVLATLQGPLAHHAQTVLEQGWVRPNKRIFNNEAISDHFAIIPTSSEPKNLDDIETKIYDMIARRFVATFFPAAEIDVTTRLSKVGEHTFKTEGKVITSPGWYVVVGKTLPNGDNDSAPSLPPLSPADGHPPKAKTLEALLHEESTKPPPRYNEATLLSAMEGAGKLLTDEDLAEAMKERGLGTPATRADIIDGLIYQKYIERAQRDLTPTPKAEQLLQFLTAVKAEQITSPAMTGEWEFKLRQMEHGKVSRKKFMQEIIDLTKGIVERVKAFEEDDSAGKLCDFVSPTDGKPMVETLRGYKSADGTFMVYKIVGGRKLEETEVRELVTHGELGPIEGFVSSKTGNKFTAKLKIVVDEKTGNKKVALDLGNKVDVAALSPFWTDPKTGAELCEAATNYVLREREGDEWKSTFQVGRLMCQKSIRREDAIQLVTEGKTELIKAFISRKGRPFDAFLVRQGARITWEFPPRESKSKDGSKSPRQPKAALDLSTAIKIGTSRSHGGADLLQTPDLYVVAKPGSEGSQRVVFKLNRVLCQRELLPDEIRSLVETGRTELIEDLVSKRGSKFSAYLVLSKTKAKADFEFPPR